MGAAIAVVFLVILLAIAPPQVWVVELVHPVVVMEASGAATLAALALPLAISAVDQITLPAIARLRL